MTNAQPLTAEELAERQEYLKHHNPDEWRAQKPLFDTIDALRDRLEINHHCNLDGERLPWKGEMGSRDGIACRDETIRLQDKLIAALRTELTEASDALDGLPIYDGQPVTVVQGIRNLHDGVKAAHRQAADKQATIDELSILYAREKERVDRLEAELAALRADNERLLSLLRLPLISVVPPTGNGWPESEIDRIDMLLSQRESFARSCVGKPGDRQVQHTASAVAQAPPDKEWSFPTRGEGSATFHGAPAAAPDGWKLVPVEPTEEMLSAGVAAALQQRNLRPWCPPCYRAMLAAAPQPPAQTKEGE